MSTLQRFASNEIADLVKVGKGALAWASTGLGFPADADRFCLQTRALGLLLDDAACFDAGYAMQHIIDNFECYTREDITDYIWENT